MNDALLAASIIWLFVFMYAILGSVDFGAGFWGMVYSQKDDRAGALANRFLSPTWEVTNVFLVMLVVTLVAFFPSALTGLSLALLIPGSLVLLLLIIRSTFMVFAYSAQRFQRALSVVSGVTGLLIPALLVLVLPVVAGGFTDPKNGQLLADKLLTSPITYAYLAFGLTSELFLSAAFLADYSREADDDEAYAVFRRFALLFGPLSLLIGVVAVPLMGAEASWLRLNIEENRWWFFASAVIFFIGYSAYWWPTKRKDHKKGVPRAAFTAFILQFFLASAAYGMSHLPYLLYPTYTLEESVTNHNTFVSLLYSYGIGLAILVPGFYLFWRLFLKDKRYLSQE
ncbi:cytochrome bd-I ubiquinol oxidase subunit 2 apoprotein [Marininema mesophilum]|uniref:Cytochrome bd-I ubiquinol oxidase subunit 2 apoprotein n=1 Tax=Marininema mesophilum TaxID=1048340 RepID=A0A1H3C668_9BACL|nr:cytochrome d ubiquinol oxidase subunit II [Marininema mesophilum]SDX49643.1 cytochrome bd-I ubiquinol oxidase subunit 2 apoprotein [Marininema mesophilum]